MKKTLQQRRLEILEDTVKYYSKDVNRRCNNYNNNTCYYSGQKAGKKSSGCAIGRLLPLKKRLEIDEKYPQGAGVSKLIICNEIPKKIAELGTLFLQDLQDLHDVDYYWNKKGLSNDGLGKVEKIKRDYILNN